VRFAEYYGDPFRRDINAVNAGLPPIHVHPEYADEGVLQPRVLSRENSVIRAMDADRRQLFGVALYLTLLVDQTFYTYYRRWYPEFAEWTRYPKLRGDCPGGCRSHAHPETVFESLGQPLGGQDRQAFLNYIISLYDALPVMRDEIVSFFKEYMPVVDGEDVWRRCRRELPFSLRAQRGSAAAATASGGAASGSTSSGGTSSGSTASGTTVSGTIASRTTTSGTTAPTAPLKSPSADDIGPSA